jgi:hypothetical protein
LVVERTGEHDRLDGFAETAAGASRGERHSTWVVSTRIDLPHSCEICGERHTFTVVLSSNSFPPPAPGLDGRPGGMHCYDVLEGIGQCPGCGYSAPALTALPAGAEETVKSEEYRLAASAAGPDLARAWHCWSFLCEKAGDRGAAGWADLKAAWACDDSRAEEASRFFRAEVLRHFAEYLGENPPANARPHETMLLDLKRRSGRLEEATAAAEELARSGDERSREMAAFQAFLVRRGDVGGYTLEDLGDYTREPETWIERREKRASKRSWWRLWR